MMNWDAAIATLIWIVSIGLVAFVLSESGSYTWEDLERDRALKKANKKQSGH